jgi:hydroxyethylthiazole kinase-like uncharacterized protein yjeF
MPEQQNTTLPLYNAAGLRELDRLAIASGIPGYTLMTRAASAAWRQLRASWPQAASVVVLCGTGNNGGDGYVLARLALADGCNVRVLQQGEVGRLRGDALTAHDDYRAAGGTVAAFTPQALSGADVIVDALLGTGFERALDADWQALITAVNASGTPVLAIDVPSGLSSDTGHVDSVAIRAAQTVTFIARKAGLYTGQGPDVCGTVICDDLAVPAGLYAQVAAVAVLAQAPDLQQLARPRRRTAHKGAFGHVLVVGGDHGMSGAVRLAGEAALRSGAGLVSVATRPEHAATVSSNCPELMCHGVSGARALRALLPRASVLVIGPGLGQSDWARELLATVLETRLPCVVDADALNLLARDPLRRADWILTPHPGEAARLLELDSGAVQSDRFRAASSLQQRYGGVVVLKGAGTLVQDDAGIPLVCAAGNPGMASGGMGDVLSGVAGALVAQGLALPGAARAAVCVHACAADHAAREGERGLLARDVIAALRVVLNTRP